MADQSFLDQVVNPIQNAFTSLTKGSDLSGLPYEAQAAALARRQKLAEMLMQQGQAQPEVMSYKGIAAQPSVAGGLGRALSQFMGAYMGGKAEEDLATAKAKEAKDVSDIFAGLADRPDVKTEGYYLPTEQPSKTMPIGMPRGASSFMPEGEATNMGTYVPGTVTPGQHLSRSEKTNRIMAAMAAHPSMAALAPMYVQNMQNEVEDQRYATGQTRLDKQEADRLAQQALTNARNVKNDTFAQQEAARDNARAAQAHADAMQARRDALDTAAEQRKIARQQHLDDLANAQLLKPENQFQANSAGFADRMTVANKYLEDPDVVAAALNPIIRGAAKLPGGNYIVPAAKQKLDQAILSFTNAKLRQESGATIGDSEFQKADKEYFPQPGNPPEIVEQKRKEREIVTRGMVRSAGPNYRSMAESDNTDEAELKRLRALKAAKK
ncbi:MAG: hypothetical protein EBR82_28035 [Caulobacteraceae bacterium]|nr:hypothetical protein [Caulobacteraceae bacterium]